MATQVLLVCGDLIFGTKVTGTAKALSVPIVVVSNVAGALERVSDDTRLAIVDLSDPPSTTTQELSSLRAKLPEGARLVAYGSHVDAERLEAARRVGCDPVLPRSRFVVELAALLKRSDSEFESGQ